MNAERVGEWLAGLPARLGEVALGEVATLLLTVLLVVVAVRLVRRWIDGQIEDVNRRHMLRKWAGYVGGLIVIGVAVGLFVGRLAQVATVLGLIGAGLAIALQEVAKSAAGWVYLSSKSGFGPGARVEVQGIVGEVVDVGILKTTVLEVGNLVKARQSSGRLATIPNSFFLTEIVLVSLSYSPYAWQEISYLLTYESDWRRGVEELEVLGEKEYEGMEAETARAFHRLERSYAFKYGARTPIVYVRAADSGVELTLRLLTHIRSRRGVADRVTRGMLEAVERDPSLDFAYPTTRFYTRGEEGRADA